MTTGNGVNSGDTLSGVGVPPGTVVAQQLTGDPGADGTYLTNNPTTVSGTAVMTTGANVSSATFTGTLTTAHVLTVTSIVGSINIGDTVTAPLTSCGIASFNITGQSAGSPGSNGTYSTSASTGACSGISMSNKGTGISPFLSMYLQYLTIDGSDLASNFCLVLNNSNRAVVQNIVLNQCYDEVELTNSYVGTATNVWSNTRRRGDYGWWLWGAGTGGGSQAAIFDLTQVNLAASYQGISWYEDGNVATIRARHLGIQEAPVLFVSDNAVNSSQTPTYNEIYDLGLNVCWYTCMNL